MKLNRNEVLGRCPKQEKGTNFSDPFFLGFILS